MDFRFAENNKKKKTFSIVYQAWIEKHKYIFPAAIVQEVTYFAMIYFHVWMNWIRTEFGNRPHSLLYVKEDYVFFLRSLAIGTPRVAYVDEVFRLRCTCLKNEVLEEQEHWSCNTSKMKGDKIKKIFIQRTNCPLVMYFIQEIKRISWEKS